MRKFEIKQSIDLEVIVAELLELWHNGTIGELKMYQKDEFWFDQLLKIDKQFLLKDSEEPDAVVRKPLWIRIHRAIMQVDGFSIPVYSEVRIMPENDFQKLGIFSLDAIINGCTLFAEKCPVEWGKIVEGSAEFEHYDSLFNCILFKNWWT